MFSIKTCSKLNSKKKEEKNGFTFKVKKIKYERDRERERSKGPSYWGWITRTLERSLIPRRRVS